jgi:GTP-binding protein
LTDLDHQVLTWSDQHGVRCHVLLTKADKLKRGPAIVTRERVARLLESRYRHTSIQLFSALKRTGVEEARIKLDQWLGYAANAIAASHKV